MVVVTMHRLATVFEESKGSSGSEAGTSGNGVSDAAGQGLLLLIPLMLGLNGKVKVAPLHHILSPDTIQGRHCLSSHLPTALGRTLHCI